MRACVFSKTAIIREYVCVCGCLWVCGCVGVCFTPMHPCSCWKNVDYSLDLAAAA